MNDSTPMQPKGTWDARHRIRIPALTQAADSKAIEKIVGTLPGVRQVSVEADRHRVTVLYDARILDYDAVKTGLETAGFPPLDNWWSRFKARCFQYADANARENAAARPSACCNKPPR